MFLFWIINYISQQLRRTSVFSIYPHICHYFMWVCGSVWYYVPSVCRTPVSMSYRAGWSPPHMHRLLAKDSGGCLPGPCSPCTFSSVAPLAPLLLAPAAPPPGLQSLSHLLCEDVRFRCDSLSVPLPGKHLQALRWALTGLPPMSYLRTQRLCPLSPCV